MQTDLMAHLTLILPELMIGAGALILLMVGVYVRKHAYIIVTSLTIILLGLVLLAVLLAPEGGRAFTDALILDDFSKFMKVITLMFSP